MNFRIITLYLTSVFLGIVASASSEVTAQQVLPSHCRAVAQLEPNVLRAGYTIEKVQNVDPLEVRLTYLSHASFRITSPDGVGISTDYTGFDGSFGLPDIATMNTIHPGHFTHDPNPEIKHVLKGWQENGVPARHDLIFSDVVVRNVTTDINSQYTGHRPDENSIFVIETAGLCIGHLGHLSQYPTDDQLNQIGRLDIMIVHVGGIQPLSQNDVLRLANRLGTRIVIPVHWHDNRDLHDYINRISHNLSIDGRNEHSIDISIIDLPDEPKLLVLTPETSFGLFRK